MHKASEQHCDKSFFWMCTESVFLPLCTQRSFEARWWNFSHIKAICKDFPLPPLFRRISPVYSTPFMRWLTHLSTIPPAAARLCGSSCLWPLIPASGGGAARRVQQVTLASTQWVAVEREKRAFWGPPLSCLLSAHLGMCLLSCRKASAAGLSELCSSQSLYRSISLTQ